MYRVLIRNREQNQTSNFKFSFYSENGSIYQTDNLDVMAVKYKELMNSYLVTDLKVVKMIPVIIGVDAKDECGHEKDFIAIDKMVDIINGEDLY